MNKEKRLFVLSLASLFLALFLIAFASALSNPAAVYCRELGRESGNYEYSVRIDGNGSQHGVCILPDGKEYDEWDFFEGKAGKKYFNALKKEQVEKKVYMQAREDAANLKPAKPLEKETELGSLMAGSKLTGSITRETFSGSNQHFSLEDYASSDFSYWDWRDPPSATAYAQSNFTYFDSTNGWLSSVKNQGSCGSCWAFGSVGLIEAIYNLNQNDSRLNPDLSEEYLVSTCYSEYDCDGGLQDGALNYTAYEGISDDSCFPYTASNSDCSGRCTDYDSRLWNISDEGYDGYYVIGNDDTLKEALVDYGPLTIAFNMTYDIDGEGVLDCIAGPFSNHAVVLVGYNDTGDDATSYWILKNSWGSSWGLNGYFKITFEDNCNIGEYVQYAAGVNPPDFKPAIEIHGPADNLQTTSLQIAFNFSAIHRDSENSTCDLVINNTILNSTAMANNTPALINHSLQDGNYTWSIRCWEDDLGIVNSSASRTLTIDSTAPSVSLVWPSNLTSLNGSSVDFIYNASDSLMGIANCSLYLNGTLQDTNSTVNDGKNNSINVAALAAGAYNWTISCSDSLANSYQAVNYTLQVTSQLNYNISACRNITSAGIYKLNKSITDWTSPAGAACINITVSDVEIDCYGYTLDGLDAVNSYGIFAQGAANSKISNITARNCNVSDWGDGIRYEYAENSTLENNTFESNYITSIHINLSSYSTINSNYVNATANYGVMLGTSEYNLLANNTLNNNSNALFITYNSSHNRIINNTIAGSTSFAIIISTYSVNNTFQDNYLSYNSEGINFIEAAASDNIIINLTQTNNAGYDINITDTTAVLKNSAIERYSFYNAALNIENSSNSRIEFPNMTQNGTNFLEDVIIRSNYVFVNSSKTGLNRSANITFFGLGLNNPRILRNGAACPASICSIITYNSSNGTLIFNVTGFSNYTSQDYCGNGFCESGAGESCSSCSADCGSCPTAASTGSGGGGGGSIPPKTYELGVLQEGQEINRRLVRGDIVKFNLSGMAHRADIKKLFSQSMIIEINSSAFNFTLAVGESRKFNLTSSAAYDLFVKLNDITNFKANLTLRAISEKISSALVGAVEKPEKTQEQAETTPEEILENQGNVLWKDKILAASASAIVIVLLILLCYKHLKKKKHTKDGKRRKNPRRGQ